MAKKLRRKNQNFNPKQTTHLRFSICSTNKSWKQFIKTKKWNHYIFWKNLINLPKHLRFNQVFNQFNQVVTTIGVTIKDSNLTAKTEPKSVFILMHSKRLTTIWTMKLILLEKVMSFSIKNDICWLLCKYSHGNNILLKIKDVYKLELQAT